MTDNSFKYGVFLVMVAVFVIWAVGQVPAQTNTGQSLGQNKFRQIDTNGDGAISPREMEEHEAWRGEKGGNRFVVTDTNGDGIILMDEFIQHEREKEELGQPGPDNPNGEDRPSPSQENPLTTRDNQQFNRSKSGRGQSQYSLFQAISDRAQLNTIAFSGLAFLTGDFGASTFIPPGKVCDFFGFQYMRDIDAAGKGHNPMFLNRVAGNVLTILNSAQKKMFLDLAREQAPQMEALAQMRLSLIKAFHMQKDHQWPSGSTGLNKKAVIQYVGKIFARDAELSLERGKIMGKVALSLTHDQKAYLGRMKFGDFNTWPDVDERGKLKRGKKGQSKMVNVAYMTYASEFFSWVAGSVDAEVYFCPERHGTYFGGFYMKDMPDMGKRDYDISTSVTGNSGEKFLKVLSSDQRGYITSIPAQQANALGKIIDIRGEISTQLRKYLIGKKPDKKRVVALGRQYGELDGELSYLYTIAFAKVNRTLTLDQRQKLKTLRNLDGYKSAAYYIYSQPIKTPPDLDNVDKIFFNPG
ncbi:MAG: hypothetical protein GY710_12600 [Desulfobacteraceae bacterium]|nr:hypothetical protein [Desulfobacteraceae bacterium]